eukprot:Phypoly_transcript_30116.p1 GENE.Phypoly_transcript_30116~~Phypoly_transcript_30116.p1  ORF type:complete len:138 (+),score=25.55 Phypoly_transcript_30116:39-416(+)
MTFFDFPKRIFVNAISYRHYSVSANPAGDGQISEVEKMRKRLYYQSKERGMLENDLLLGNFAKKYLPEMSQEELKEYDQIVKQIDPDIFAWITGKQQIPDELQTNTMKKLLAFCKSNPLNISKNK